MTDFEGVVLGPVCADSPRKPEDDGFGPPGSGDKTQPTARELQWCTWGFLMAAVQLSKGEPPTREYLEVLAEYRGLHVPEMNNTPKEKTEWPQVTGKERLI